MNYAIFGTEIETFYQNELGTFLVKTIDKPINIPIRLKNESEIPENAEELSPGLRFDRNFEDIFQQCDDFDTNNGNSN